MATFKRDINALRNQQFDVAIVGGGISGAWLALHCAQSGYKTALVEQSDFASQTSSSSSKLLHGGIRYLQQMQFGKVRESAFERAQYITAAPHLSHALPFLVPTYKDFARSKFLLRCGMFAYRILTLGENRLIRDNAEQLPGMKSLDASQLSDLVNLGGETHTGAIQFFERHIYNSERMVLEILKTAANLGATISNYCSVTKLLENDNKITGLQVNDTLTEQGFSIDTRLVINAAGPWIDDLNSQLTTAKRSINGYAVGSHLITRKIADHAIAITTQHNSGAAIDRGGRHIFVIPWQGYSLIGTSYDEVTSPEKNMLPTAAHIRQLLDAVNHGMPNAKLTRQDLISGYSGLYPLRTNEIDSSIYQGSGEYVIIDHAKSHQRKGLITALGAKYTTGRKLSMLTLPLVQKQLGGSLNLGQIRLSCSQYSNYTAFRLSKIKQYGALLEQATLVHLLKLHGSNIDALMELVIHDKLLGKPICNSQPDIHAQIIWAIRHEQAETLEDILFRRTSLGFFGISEAEVKTIAKFAQQEAQWSDAQTDIFLAQVNVRIQAIATALDTAHPVSHGSEPDSKMENQPYTT